MYERMDMQPISTWMVRREGWRCFVFVRWESSIWGDGKLGWGLVINTPGPRSSGRLEVRLVTRVNTRGTWPLTLLMGHRKPSMNWYPLCRIPPQDLSHSQLSPTSPPPPKKHTGYLWHRPQQQMSNWLFRSAVKSFSLFLATLSKKLKEWEECVWFNFPSEQYSFAKVNSALFTKLIIMLISQSKNSQGVNESQTVNM